ncbi:thioesterase [Dactylosporangium roseum]|uniref:Thioesterase n=2 Tax=Dactylosporangium roseum TaxID=47989 RepID=A0ABY5ZHH0_9ACTN|nr:thioesterase [Dactylosporangium roseum]
MIPGAGGGLMPYLRVAAHLGDTYNVTAVRAAGLVPDEAPEASVPKMAAGVLDALDADGLQPDVVFGWSMGGTVAWEVCADYAERGHHPDLVMVDCSPFRRPSDPEGDQEILDLILGMLGPRPDPQTAQRVTATFEAHAVALDTFATSRTYPGRVLLLVCAGRSDLDDRPGRAAALRRWRELAPDLQVGSLEADHFRVFDPERLPELTEHLGAFLRPARSEVAP